MALKKLATQTAGRSAAPNARRRQSGLGSVMAGASSAAGLTPASPASGRYTVDDISAIIRGRGAIPMGVGLGDELFAKLGIQNGWDMVEQGDTGNMLPGGMSQAAREALGKYRFDWTPQGSRVENGWLTAFHPDGTQAARIFQGYEGETQNTIDAAALAAAGFAGVGALTGLGPLGGLGAAGGSSGASGSAGGGAAAGAGGGAAGMTAAEQIAFLSANGMTDAAIASSFPGLASAGGLTGVGAAGAGLGAAGAAEGATFTYATPGAEQSFGLLNAAGDAAAADAGMAAAMDAAGSWATPEALQAWGASAGVGVPELPAIAGLGAAGNSAPAVFNAAADSQAANAALGLGPTTGGVPSAVNLGSAGGLQSTGGGWGIFDPIAGAVSGAKDAVSGVIGEKGTDLLWNLGKGAIGTALAGGAANALAPKVDTSGLEANAASARDIANRQMSLAEKQYADQQALLSQYSPMIQELIKGQLTDQGLSRERSTAQWNDYTNVWRPTELAFNKQSMDFANPARYQQEADRAGVDAATQFDRAKQQQVRQLQMAGASPEKIAALTAAGDILAAKGTAGARSQAYRDSEMKGLNVLQGAASFGRNMPSTGIQTAALAGQQGQQGMAGVQGLSSMTATPATIASNLMGQSLNANNTATQSLLQAQNLGLQAANNRNAIFGDILGAGLGAIGMNGGFSSLFGGKP